MTTKTETVVAALAALLTTSLSPIEVKRNCAAPEEIPAAGLVIVRDGDPGDPDRVLGGDGYVYYSHKIEVEIYVAEADQAARDAAYDDLLAAVGVALESDDTLGGAIEGMFYTAPSAVTEYVEGGADIKTGTVIVEAEYGVTNPLG